MANEAIIRSSNCNFPNMRVVFNITGTTLHQTLNSALRTCHIDTYKRIESAFPFSFAFSGI